MHYIKHNLIFSLTGTGNFRIFYGAQTLSINFVSLSTRVSRNLSLEYVWNQPTSLHWLSISFNIKFKILIWSGPYLLFSAICHQSSLCPNPTLHTCTVPTPSVYLPMRKMTFRSQKPLPSSWPPGHYTCFPLTRPLSLCSILSIPLHN